MCPQLDKSVINDLATGDQEARNKSLIKFWCKVEKYTVTHQQASQHTHELLVWTAERQQKHMMTPRRPVLLPLLMTDLVLWS